MRSVLIAAAAAITLLATPVLAEGERAVVFERLFADGFVANEQAYMVFEVPVGSRDVAFELDCNIHAGTLTLQGFDHDARMGAQHSVACDGLLERAVLTGALAPGHYYGAASFTGVNGVWFRVTTAS